MNPSVFGRIFIYAGLLINFSMAQSSFHMDPYRNTFTIQTPSLQQTFTRYYGHPAGASASGIGGGTTVGEVDYVNRGGVAAAGGSVTNNGGVDSGFLEQFHQNKLLSNYNISPQQLELFRNQQILQQQQQYYFQQLRQQQDQQLGTTAAQLKLAQTTHPIIGQSQPIQNNQQLSSSIKSQQQQQQQHQHQQQQQQPLGQYSTQDLAAQKESLLGVAFSPSNEVSKVKFSSGTGLKYNF